MTMMELPPLESDSAPCSCCGCTDHVHITPGKELEEFVNEDTVVRCTRCTYLHVIPENGGDT